MSIGANWAEIWKPVWKAVWTQVPAIPPDPPTGDVPGIDLGWGGGEVSVKTPKWWEKSGQPDEEEAKPAKAKREPKRLSESKEKARQVIEAVAKDQIERGNVPKDVRFAEVRSQLKPIGADFNWPALYERLYSQLLTQAIRQEMDAAAAIHRRRMDEETVLLLIEA